MRRGAGAAGSGHHVIGKAPAVTEESWNRYAVRVGSVLLDTASRTIVAAGAAIHVNDQQTLGFVETLFRVFVQERCQFLVTMHPLEYLGDESFPHRGELIHHFQEAGSV